MRRPANRSARPQPRRDALLTAAIEVVAEHGVAGTTHRAVTEHAGVPLATISYYFSSIDELIAEAMQGFARERVRKMTAPMQDSSARASASEVSARLVELFGDSSQAQRLAFFELLVHAGRWPELGESAQQALAAYQAAAQSVLTAVDAPADQQHARAFVAMGLGYGLLRIADPAAGDWPGFRTALLDLLLGQEYSRDHPDDAARRTGEK